MRKLALLVALLAAPAVANAAAATMSYSSSSGRWIATCPAASGVAACTLDCTNSPIAVTCSDSDTCAFTLDESHTYFDGLNNRTASAFLENDECVVTNRGSNAITFATSSGVQELDATVTLAQYVTKRFIYSNARWTGKTNGAVTGDYTVTGDLTVTGGDITGVVAGIDLGEATANVHTLTRTTSGTVTVTAADDDATAALTVLPGGAAAMVVGGTSTTSNSILSNTASVLVGTTANTVVLGRLTSGTATLTAADDDATAALTVLPGGAAALTLGGASMTSLTVTTDGTGTGEVVLPNGSIGVPELARPGHFHILICGDADTVSTNTVYYGPSQVIASSATAGMRTCNTTATGNTTEGTAAAAALTGTAFGVASMVCTSDNPGVASGLSFTLRTASGVTVPSVTCSVANGAAGTCVANIQTTTDIASAATVDVAVAGTGAVGTVHFICDVDAVF